MARQHLSDRKRNELEDQVIFLLLRCMSRYELVRAKVRDAVLHLAPLIFHGRCTFFAQAASYLSQLVSRFPQIQWNKICLSVLLDLMHMIETTVDSDQELAPNVMSNLKVLSLLLLSSCYCTLAS